MTRLEASAFLLVIALFVLSPTNGASADRIAVNMNLPETVDAWTRSDPARIIDSSTIFGYMNGGGELYLAYGFDHLEIFEYKAPQRDDVVVEVYVMHNADDAFGLLSLDWGGEPLTLAPSIGSPTKATVAPPYRALYGMGLLRLSAANIYARVLTYRETPEARKAIISLGRAIAANLKAPDEPELLSALPLAIGSDWELRRDRIGYFHTHLVLNSLYYVSHQNILDLSHDTMVVAAPYDATNGSSAGKRSQLLFIAYPSPVRASQGLDHFHDAYLPEHKKDTSGGSSLTRSSYFKIEDGWIGYRLGGKHLAVVFGCPDRKSARMFMEHVALNTLKEAGHEE